MVKRRKITRHVSKPAPRQPAPVDVDETEMEGEDEDVDEGEGEEEEDQPVRTSRRVTTKAPVEDDEDDDEDDDDGGDDDGGGEDEDDDEDYVAPVNKPKVKTKKVVPPPAAKKGAPAKAAPKAAPKVEPVKVQSVDKAVAEDILTGLLEALDEGGKSLVIVKVKDNKWNLSLSDGVKAGGKMTSSEAWHATVSDEFLEWSKTWNAKSFEEKKKYAKQLKCKWEENDDPRIEVMRITQAVREKEGIEKYKPEYRTRAARAALRAGGA